MSVSINGSTTAQLSAQWANPSDVLSLLLIIGGDIIQTALAQTAGDHITPVCFSFGWVAYSFSTVVRVLGDGRLLPTPDYPVKVFNLGTSYVRENKNWVIGRILRDNEVFMNKIERHAGSGIRISIFTVNGQQQRYLWIRSLSNICWLVVTLLQLGIASIPWARDGEWGVFLITLAGTIAAFLAGQLPQWRIEKLPLKQRSKKHVAITSGNGSRDIMIIYGGGNGLDLEELAASESPRSDRVWEAVHALSRPVKDERGKEKYYKNGNQMRRTLMWRGLPMGLWLTRVASLCQIIFWLALLITVAGLRSHTWYLVIVGSLGMLQNAMLAAAVRKPKRRGLPLRHVDTIRASRIMDGLMDLEATIGGAGVRLLEEFFPGYLREAEIDWWAGQRDLYDSKRMQEGSRGIPRSRLERKSLDIPDIDLTGKSHLYSRTPTWESGMLDITEEVELQDTQLPLRTIPGDPRGSDLRKNRDYEGGGKQSSTRYVYGPAGPVQPALNTIKSPDWT